MRNGLMTLDKLYDYITKIVASPHTAITEHDKRRALHIITIFQDFVLDCVDDDNDVHTIEFVEYVNTQLDILEGK